MIFNKNLMVIKTRKTIVTHAKRQHNKRCLKRINRQETPKKIGRILRKKFNKQIPSNRKTNQKPFRGEEMTYPPNFNIEEKQILNVLKKLGFKLKDGERGFWFKRYSRHNYEISIKIDEKNIKKSKIDYGNLILVQNKSTSNLSKEENLVVLDCVDRLLEKGYKPESLILEKNWKLGHNEKGSLDILVLDNEKKAFLMIECKTFGIEFQKEIDNMHKNGGQLLSYLQQEQSTKYVCLYTTNFQKEYQSNIIKIGVGFIASNNKETYKNWNGLFEYLGIFEENIEPYGVRFKYKTIKELKEIQKRDGGYIFNQFREVLRRNVVSDKTNAYNKIFNLFLCKIVDEDRNANTTKRLSFQYFEAESNEDFLNRLNNLYKEGMKKYLQIEITDYNPEEVIQKLKLNKLSAANQEELEKVITALRLYKNNEFAFREIYDKDTFNDNSKIVKDVVELLENYRIKYSTKHQFLGDFFEKLLNTGIKQEVGQFFTPIPIARFICKSIPFDDVINKKIKAGEPDFLPYLIDYASGAGHFLTEGMDFINRLLQNIPQKNLDRRMENNYKNYLNNFAFARDYVYGIEKDYRLTKTTKISCFLNGDGDANIICADGLDNFSKSLDYKGILLNKYAEEDNPVFDILIANPPFSVNGFRNTLNNGEESFSIFDNFTEKSSEIECFFVERTKQLLKEGGFAGIILPVSLLTNDKVHIYAREILLKNFDICGIVKLSQKTFMATGTITVILFLRKRNISFFEDASEVVDKFLNDKTNVDFFNIPNIFTEYLKEVYDDLEFDSYLNLLNDKEDDKLYKSDIYRDYQREFKRQKKIKDFKEFVINIEREKLTYFLVTHVKQTIVIDVGERKKARRFLGYEFSNRKGYEGIQEFSDTNQKIVSKLYSDYQEGDLDLNDKTKSNYYIRKMLQGKDVGEIDDSLKDNLKIVRFSDLMDFSKPKFDKRISTNVKVKVKFNTNWDVNRLGDICNIKIGGTPDRDKEEYYENGKNLWLSIGEMEDNVITDTEEKINEKGISASNVKLVKKGTTLLSFKLSIGKTAIAGKDLYTNEAIAGLEPLDDKKVSDKYLFHLFSSKYINLDASQKIFGESLNSDSLADIRIPQPPKDDVQNNIVNECDRLSEEEDSIRIEVHELKNNISKEISDIFKNTPKKDFMSFEDDGKLAKLKRGPFGGSLTKSIFVSEGYKIYEQQNAINNDMSLGYYYITKEKYKEMEGFALKPNDLIVSCSGTMGKVAIFTEDDEAGIINQALLRITPNEKMAVPIYIKYMLEDISIQNKYFTATHGMGISNVVSVDELKKIKIPIIDRETEQPKFIEKIKFIENKIYNKNLEIDKIKVRKRQIISKYIGNK